MPSLRDVQDAVRRSLIGLDEGAAAPYVVADGIAPDQRLAVYRHTFDSNLVNALRLSFPAVCELVGTEFFAAAATMFAHAHPPRGSWLDAYGAEFADFIGSFPPAASLPYLADVARLECAVSGGLHAADAVPLDAHQLAAIDPQLHERIRFTANPSITLLRTDYPADTIWRAVLAGDDAALAAIDLAEGPARLLVQRMATGIDVTRLDKRAWHISTALFAGQPLGLALHAVDETTAARVLAGHLAAGRLVAFSLAESTHDGSTTEIAP